MNGKDEFRRCDDAFDEQSLNGLQLTGLKSVSWGDHNETDVIFLQVANSETWHRIFISSGLIHWGEFEEDEAFLDTQEGILTDHFHDCSLSRPIIQGVHATKDDSLSRVVIDTTEGLFVFQQITQDDCTFLFQKNNASKL